MKAKSKNQNVESQVKIDFTKVLASGDKEIKANNPAYSGKIIQLNTNPRREIYNRIINRTME